MTIIVVSVSWLMAIICIMFGSYHHIKMFFTLCLTMVLWSPILSIINYLNDLNIQSVFADLVLKDDAALTYSNYKQVVQKVTENSNFLKYLVMMTPMLAFALAKGSEMGFVSIASSLSQQLAGASRAAAGFATQQALSTSTAITSPRGDEVYAREAGIDTHKFAQAHNGSVVAMAATGLAGGAMLNLSATSAGGSTATISLADGQAISGNIATASAGSTSASSKQTISSITNALQDFSTKQGAAELLSANGVGHSGNSTNITGTGSGDNTSVKTDESAENKDTDSERWGRTVNTGTDINLKAGKSGGGSGGSGGKGEGSSTTANGGVGISAAKVDTNGVAWSLDETKSGSTSGSKGYNLNRNDVATLLEDKSRTASLIDSLKTSRIEGATELAALLEGFTQTESFSTNVSTNNAAYMINSHLNAGSGLGAAVTALEKQGAIGDMSGLTAAAGARNNEGIDGSGLRGANNYTPDDLAVRNHNAAGSAAVGASVRPIVENRGPNSRPYLVGEGELLADHPKNSSRIEEEFASPNGPAATLVAGANGRLQNTANWLDGIRSDNQKGFRVGDYSFSLHSSGIDYGKNSGGYLTGGKAMPRNGADGMNTPNIQQSGLDLLKKQYNF